MTTSAELAGQTVPVTPGGETATPLTVRNDSDIVEAYTLEVVGDCAAWSTVEPARISLYPGTSETVTVRLSPPRTPEVRAGEVPLGVRVLPTERPDSVVVPETTVSIAPFRQLRTDLEPRRRRGWRSARYRTVLHNQGNTAVTLALAGSQPGEDLRFDFRPDSPRLAPGAEAEARLRVRTGKLIWFGKPATWPFDVNVRDDGDDPDEAGQPGRPTPLDGEFLQLPILPKWLLALLAALLALLLAWFALVRPAVRSTARQAADEATGQGDRADGGQQDTGGEQSPPPGGSADGSKGGGKGGAGGTGGGSGGGQSSATIKVRTGGGARNVGTYTVPEGKVFGVTDLVVANYQGDEGLLTITFGERTITTIALETFRNQDYHWVTPIEIPQNATVTADVTCDKPGTPASGKQASDCAEVLNVSGELRDIKP